MRKTNEKLDRRLTDLMKFYAKKSRESSGGIFFIPEIRGIKHPTIWARNKEELSKWARKERIVIDKLLPLV